MSLNTLEFAKWSTVKKKKKLNSKYMGSKLENLFLKKLTMILRLTARSVLPIILNSTRNVHSQKPEVPTISSGL